MPHKLLEEAVAQHKRGNLDRAETLYRKILKSEPEDADALHLLGCVELGRNHRERAISLMRRAVDLAPAIPLFHENLAEAYHRDGQHEMAVAECRLALRFDPRRPKAM